MHYYSSLAEQHKSTDNCVRAGVKPLGRSCEQASRIPQAKGTEIGSGKVGYTCNVNKNIKRYFQILLQSKLYHGWLLHWHEVALPSTTLVIRRAALTQGELGAEMPLLPPPCQAKAGCWGAAWCHTSASWNYTRSAFIIENTSYNFQTLRHFPNKAIFVGSKKKKNWLLSTLGFNITMAALKHWHNNKSHEMPCTAQLCCGEQGGHRGDIQSSDRSTNWDFTEDMAQSDITWI